MPEWEINSFRRNLKEKPFASGAAALFWAAAGRVREGGHRFSRSVGGDNALTSFFLRKSPVSAADISSLLFRSSACHHLLVATVNNERRGSFLEVPVIK
jgi:hypothetical protein